MARRSTAMMISSRLRRGATVLQAALALAALAAAPASAVARSPSPVAFAVSAVGSGSSIRLHGSPGRVLHGAVLVRNLSLHRVTVILQTADVENASSGNADFVTTRLHHAGRWLQLSSGAVHLAPDATQRVVYAVRIPATATGASHYAGIVATNAADLVSPAARGKSTGRAFSFYRINREALPLTIHLPGPLTRSLSLRSVKLIVQPIGAGLVLGLLPGGTELTEGAQVNLRVLRGARTILTNASALGQLFPTGSLDYRIAWPRRPTPGTYRVVGTISPKGSAVIKIDQTIAFADANARKLTQVTPTVPGAPSSGVPVWVWIALGIAAALLIALLVTVYRLSRRPRAAVA
jgi:hypothetical protein